MTLSVVGAEIGVPLASLGNNISDFGSILELGIDALNAWSGSEDYGNIIKKSLYRTFKKNIDKRMNKLFQNTGLKFYDNTFDIGRSIFKQGINLKIMLLEKVLDTYLEKKEEEYE